MTALLENAVSDGGELNDRLDPKELAAISDWVKALKVEVPSNLGDPESDPAARRAAQLAGELGK